MKTLAEKIAVMQAAERGEKIEKLSSTGQWEVVDSCQIGWDWCCCNYRVATRTVEIVVVAWRTSPQSAFALDIRNYKARPDKEQMLLLSKQTITY